MSAVAAAVEICGEKGEVAMGNVNEEQPCATTPPPEELPETSAPTTSCTRSFSDLDPVQFGILIGALCATRTAIQQPLNLALVRKQCCPVAAQMSTTTIIYRIAALEGGALVGLSQGMAAFVLASALSETVYMLGYEYFREALPIAASVTREATAGYLGDAVSRCVHIPLLCVANRQMIRMQFEANAAAAAHEHHLHRSVATGPKCNLWGTMKLIYGENGIRSLYNGFLTSVTIGCFWTGAWWASYDLCKNVMYSSLNAALDRWHMPHANPNLHHHHSSAAGDAPSHLHAHNRTHAVLSLPHWVIAREDNFLVNSVASITASAATAVIFNPFLVIRTRLTTTPGGTFYSVSKSIVQQGGLLSFWVGSWLNVTTSVIDGYLGSTCYEVARLWSDKTRN